MMLRILLASLVFVAAGSCFAAQDAAQGGLLPWRFQMTPEDVRAQTAYGPYRAFSNGDLETYAGVFDNEKENVQFYFKEGRLVRIGIHLYEGNDAQAAAGRWLRAYESLKKAFGDIELPGLNIDPKTATSDKLLAAAIGNMVAHGKTQMAPVKQPADKFVFSSFASFILQGVTYYQVTVYYDPPHQ